MAVAVHTEAGHGKKAAPEKKPVVTREAQERSSTTYKKADVIVVRGREQNESFSVRRTTETTLANAVQEFVRVLDSPQIAKGTIAPWQKAFIDTFKQRYPNYDPNKLQEYALQFVQTSQGLVAALKIAEWQLATYQRATGAYIEEVRHHEVRDKSTLLVSGGDPAQEITHGNGFRSTLRESVRESADRDRQRERLSRFFYPERHDTSYYDRVNMGRGKLTYATTGLDTAQKVYLTRLDVAGKTFTGQEAESERLELRRIIGDITQARVDVYQVTGKMNIRMNTIDKKNTGYVAAIQEPHLLVERTAASGGKVRAKLVAEIKAVQASVQLQATEEIDKAQKKDRQSQTQATVDQQITELGAPLEGSPVESQRLAELDQRIPQLQEMLRKAKKPAEIQGEIDALNAGGPPPGRIPQLETRLNAIRPNLAQDRRDLPNKEFDRDDLVRERDLRLEWIRQWEVDKRATGLTAAQIAVIDGQIAAVKNELSTAWNGGVGINSRIQTISHEINTIQKLLQEGQGRAITDALSTAEAELGSKTAELTAAEQEKAQILVEVQGLIAGTNAANLDANIQTLLSAARAEKQGIELSGLGRERQLQILRTYKEAVLTGNDPDDLRTDGKRSSLEGINNRAQNIGMIPLEISADYADYPQAYLRVIQVVFGVQSVRPGSEALFARATQMIPPEKLFRIYNEAQAAKAPPGPPLANMAALGAAVIEPCHIQQLLKDLQTEALHGDLGKFSDYSSDDLVARPLATAQREIQLQFERVRTTPPRDATFNPADANVIAQRDILSQAIPQYDTLEDLARRIMEQWRTVGWAGRAAAGLGTPAIGGIAALGDLALGTDYFVPNSANDAVLGDARRMAEEIDRRRVWRKKIHTPQQQVAP